MLVDPAIRVQTWSSGQPDILLSADIEENASRKLAPDIIPA
jgi:hypothetical protein